MKPEFADFRIDELMHQIEFEFAPLAREKGLDLTFMPCSLMVRSDRRLLRRLLQNLISNADQIYAGRARAGRLPAARRAAARRSLRHRHRHPARQAPRRVQGIPPARSGRAGRARPRPRSFDRRAHRARARLRGDAEIQCRPRLALCGRGAAGAEELAAPKLPTPPRLNIGQLDGTTALCIDNERAMLDGMETLLGRLGLRT